MRIAGGLLKGRRLVVPKEHIRPTQEKVREALFSILGEKLEGADFLDLFAGSGAVGIEAWSRGASNVCLVDSSRRVLDVLKKNVLELCDDTVEVVSGDVLNVLKKKIAGRQFDIIFADPPYSRGQKSEVRSQRSATSAAEPPSGHLSRHGRDDVRVRRQEQGDCEGLLEVIGEAGVLADDGVFVMEQASADGFNEKDGWVLTADRVYGDAGIGFYIKKA
jgi:16S rRNA (guanine(966)-N(2))-methyltransferase RsmD